MAVSREYRVPQPTPHTMGYNYTSNPSPDRGHVHRRCWDHLPPAVPSKHEQTSITRGNPALQRARIVYLNQPRSCRRPSERTRKILRYSGRAEAHGKLPPTSTSSMDSELTALQLTNWRLIPHVIATICGLAPISTMMSYAPTLVHSFGYERLKSNAMASIGAFILIIITVAWGHIG